MSSNPHKVLLFESVSAVLAAEKILKQERIVHKIIPVPKQLSTDCGVCIRINEEDLETVGKALLYKVKIGSINEIQ